MKAQNALAQVDHLRSHNATLEDALAKVLVIA